MFYPVRHSSAAVINKSQPLIMSTIPKCLQFRTTVDSVVQFRTTKQQLATLVNRFNPIRPGGGALMPSPTLNSSQFQTIYNNPFIL